MKCKQTDSIYTSSMQIGINTDTIQIDALIVKLERAVELQKQLSKAVRAVEESITMLSHRDSFIR
ncbi:hypothetical protein [Yersinia rochesterensis]|uniref:Uncharacterized protein n=1 Tax=Yersinia rochesterensis TaxID=1604335 RepID=A0A8D4SSW7_9GAMM|nr:hypothetical protein [Yersinia rochesterensis]AYD44765.1 hypothetical protein DXZ79_14330 [Yersinia rochesterensis]